MSARLLFAPLLLTLATDTAFSPANGSYRATIGSRVTRPEPKRVPVNDTPLANFDISLLDTTARGVSELAYNSSAYDAAIKKVRGELPPEGHAYYDVMYTRGPSGMGLQFSHLSPVRTQSEWRAADPNLRPYLGDAPPPPRYVSERQITVTPTQVLDGFVPSPEVARRLRLSSGFSTALPNVAAASQTVGAAGRQARFGAPWAEATYASPSAEAARRQGAIDHIRTGAALGRRQEEFLAAQRVERYTASTFATRARSDALISEIAAGAQAERKLRAKNR